MGNGTSSTISNNANEKRTGCKIFIRSNFGGPDTFICITNPQKTTWAQLTKHVIENEFLHTLLTLLLHIHPHSRLSAYRLRYDEGYGTLILPTWHTSGIHAEELDLEDAYVDMNVYLRPCVLKNASNVGSDFSRNRTILDTLGEECMDNATFVEMCYEKIGGGDNGGGLGVAVAVGPFPLRKDTTNVLRCWEHARLPGSVDEYTLAKAGDDANGNAVLPRRCVNYADELEDDDMMVTMEEETALVVNVTHQEEKSQLIMEVEEEAAVADTRGTKDESEKVNHEAQGSAAAAADKSKREGGEHENEKENNFSEDNNGEDDGGTEYSTATDKLVSKKVDHLSSGVKGRISTDKPTTWSPAPGRSAKKRRTYGGTAIKAAKSEKARDVSFEWSPGTQNDNEEAAPSKSKETKKIEIDVGQLAKKNPLPSKYAAKVAKKNAEASDHSKANHTSPSARRFAVMCGTSDNNIETSATEVNKVDTAELFKKTSVKVVMDVEDSPHTTKKKKTGKTTAISTTTAKGPPCDVKEITIEKNPANFDDDDDDGIKDKGTTTTQPKSKKKQYGKKTQREDLKPIPTHPTGENDTHIPAEPAEGFPSGWTKRRIPRTGGSISDLYLYSPMNNYKFRSKPDAIRFLEAVKMAEGDEGAAILLHKKTKKSPGNKRAVVSVEKKKKTAASLEGGVVEKGNDVEIGEGENRGKGGNKRKRGATKAVKKASEELAHEEGDGVNAPALKDEAPKKKSKSMKENTTGDVAVKDTEQTSIKESEKAKVNKAKSADDAKSSKVQKAGKKTNNKDEAAKTKPQSMKEDTTGDVAVKDTEQTSTKESKKAKVSKAKSADDAKPSKVQKAGKKTNNKDESPKKKFKSTKEDTTGEIAVKDTEQTSTKESKKADTVFDYGIKMKNKKSGNNGPGTCIVKFSLMEESEGYPIDISPYNNAYEVLRKIESQNSSTEQLDLILKAHVMMIMCRKNDTLPSPRKRKNVCQDMESIDDVPRAKRNGKGYAVVETCAVENHPADVTTEHPSRKPPALGKAQESRRISTAPANEERKAGSKSEIQIPAASSDAECGDDDEGMSVGSDAEETKRDNKKVNSQPCGKGDVASYADGLVASPNVAVDNSEAGNNEMNENTTQAEAEEDSSSSESNGDSSSESSGSSSIGSEEPEDEDEKSPTVSFAEHHEDNEPDAKNAPARDAEEKTTDRRISSPPSANLSATVPRVRFESKGERNGAKRHRRRGRIESSSTPLMDEAEKSDESSLANGDGEESSSDDGELDDEESNEKIEVVFKVSASSQPSRNNETSQLNHTTQRSDSPASEDGRPSGVGATNEEEETKDKTANAPESAGDEGRTGNSSSSSGSDGNFPGGPDRITNHPSRPTPKKEKRGGSKYFANIHHRCTAEPIANECREGKKRKQKSTGRPSKIIRIVKRKPFAKSPMFMTSSSSIYAAVCKYNSLLDALHGSSSSSYGVHDGGESSCSLQGIEESLITIHIHFGGCPIFEQQFDSFVSNNIRDDSSQLWTFSLVERALQHSVRHLCDYECYRRAYCPIREFTFLWRDITIVQDSDEKVSCDATAKSTPPSCRRRHLTKENLLSRWTCQILPTATLDNSNDTMLGLTSNGGIVSNTNKRKSNNDPSPVVYISPNGTEFNTKAKAVNYMNKSFSSSQLQSKTASTSILSSIHSSSESTTTTPLIDTTTNTNPLYSPFGLLEELFLHDPWKLLVSTICLNVTTRAQVDRILHRFLARWPNAETTSRANWEEISHLISPLGLGTKRAKGLVRFSEEYIALIGTKEEEQKGAYNDPFALTEKQVKGLYNVGQYAWTAYEVFILGKLPMGSVKVCDHALQLYVEYQLGRQASESRNNK